MSIVIDTGDETVFAALQQLDHIDNNGKPTLFGSAPAQAARAVSTHSGNKMGD
jgi:hypothetical protein